MMRLHAMTDVNVARLPIAPGYRHDGLTAATRVDNPGAQRALARNGFVRTGTREDPDDGTPITWAIDLIENGRPA